MEWSTIQQISVYVDALSNPFMQQYSQVTIDVNTFNSEGPSILTPNLVGCALSSELVVPELSHFDITSYWHIVNYHFADIHKHA